MLPTILSRQLETGIKDYIETTFPMTNAPFKGSVENLLATKDSVYHEPYVAVRLPFRVAEKMPTMFQAVHPQYLPYVHQEKAFERLTGEDGRSTLIATGTGSGKTECFLYPILEYCYRHRGEPGIKALIIYPMNALASDQAKRIAELIHESPELNGNVTCGMYVGGVDGKPQRLMTEHGVITDHETMLNHAPDILMTNYKMLDYLLVRPKDAMLWQDNKSDTLKYVAVDELHTFDGAQGTDLACLLRRLKRRLQIFPGTLCCIGTSATMGSKTSSDSIIEYASQIFGEPFERDSVITEDRLSAAEFIDGLDITEFTMPTKEQTDELERYASDEDPSDYLKCAVNAWFPDFTEDVLSDDGRINLGKRLMHHSFMQSVVTFTGGNYYQVSKIKDELSTHYPELKEYPNASVVIDSLFALISHARTGSAGHLRPFLFVQVQLWMRELRRLLAKVDPVKITYQIGHDLNSQQSKHYLPVVNCRDCGITGWVSILDERQNATMRNLDGFYNRYFRADDQITMMFPRKHGERMPGMMPAKLCPECLSVSVGEEGSDQCPHCGSDMIDIFIPITNPTSGTKSHRQFVCPCCGSRRGLSLVGLRGSTEISASISEMFASKFNDDKKTLTFSDSVQDAAYRAGFFNSRTWKVGLRTAIQKYCKDEGNGKSLAEYQEGFLQYWHEKFTDEEFVSFFIAPNMTWKHAYEDMVEKRELGKDTQAKILMHEIEERLRYEIMLEYGLTGKIGRTLEKSGCSVLSFAPKDIEVIAKAVEERVKNELSVLPEETALDYQHMVIGYLNLMRMNGSFADDVFQVYLKNGFNAYLLSNDMNRWLPGLQSGRNTPRFLVERLSITKKRADVDTPEAKKYTEWIKSCCKTLMVEPSTYVAVGKIILDEAVKSSVVSILSSAPEYRVYGLNKDRVYISSDVVMMRCDTCGSIYAISKEDLPFYDGAPCQRANCAGAIHPDDSVALDYYKKLYSAGDLERINAREHTGLLERADREQLENDFKRKKEDRALWDPNVLSCTPTLEMGIDIGDLSTVILCSMPPAQSQYLQRAGRAGRKDGNALTLAIANARPHDLYFYQDPMEMISGNVTPPKIFLRASAVLERQFVAFCMDSWVKNGVPDGAIPEHVKTILGKLDKKPMDMFPFNFLQYVKGTLSRQLNSFTQMFAGAWGTTEESKIVTQELEDFARGDGTADSPMCIRIIDAFQGLKQQQDSLQKSIDNLKDMIKEYEDKPKDSSYDEIIKDLKGEQAALLNVLQELGKKNVFNFMSDEGLLPNYAFPEAGIILKAILYRKEDEKAAVVPAGTEKKRKYEKMVYEYNRSASSAISEFAPNNNFYVEGRKLTIDQVDLTTAKPVKWRLCPSCSYAEIEETGKHVACCPRCGSPDWADAGQVRNMLKVQMVYSNMDYTKSLINDESDDRTNIFYCKQMLVDVDEDHDITSAYEMDNKDFPFGYEFVRKATLREINFGESDSIGEKMSVAGEAEVRNGFKICKYCGKIQNDHVKGSGNHTFSCKTRKFSGLLTDDAYEECLFLYREFNTEVLRLLIPATTMDSSAVKLESFVAAFMLGMKEYFGNVDHLRATVSEVPVPDADYRKQYLVIYDSVPGGTGYLKQLMQEKDALIQIFEKALDKMENCSCKDDPEKDGCYHCLFAYRQSQHIGNISRRAAISMLKSILSGKDNLKKINRINEIKTNPLFDSELEQQFIEAIRMKVGLSNIMDSTRDGKHSYFITIDKMKWEIEPQVLLDASQGVKVQSKPDFVIWPISADNHLPVAVFTDGFLYHKDIVTDDTCKREAIRRSGKFRVWSLSYKDVQSVFSTQETYATETLEATQMPYATMYVNMVKKGKGEALEPAKLSAFDHLMFYLTEPDAERLFKVHADGYAYALLQPTITKSKEGFDAWKEAFDGVNNATHFTNIDYTFPNTFFGTWKPRTENNHLTIYAGVLAKESTTKAPAVCAVLQDDKEKRTDRYEYEWNGMLHFSNICQFLDEYIAVSTVGIEKFGYMDLPIPSEEETETTYALTETTSDDGWNAVLELLMDDQSKDFVQQAREAGIKAPSDDNVGFEVEGSDGEVIATVEIAWPEQKIGYLTEEQLEDQEKLEQEGWRIMNLLNIKDFVDVLGGKN